MEFIQELQRLSPMAKRLVAIKFLIHLGLMASYYIGVLGTMAYSAGGGALEGSVTVGVMNLMMIVGVFVGGAFVDAFGPRRHLALARTLICVACAVFIVLSGSVAGIFVGTAFFGFAMGVGDPIFRAYPAYLTSDRDELKVVNSALNTAVSLDVIIGPLVGSAISLAAPTQVVFAFTAFAALLSLFPSRGFEPLRDPHEDDACDGQPAARDSALAGFKTVFTSPTLRLLVTAGFLAFFAYGAFDPLEALYYRDVLSVDVEWMGILSSASGVGAVVGGLAVLRLPERHVNLWSFMWCLALCGFSCFVYVATSNVWVALLGQFLVGVANGAFNPLQSTLVQLHAPLKEVGRVSAAIGFGYTASGVLPLFFAPWLADIFGVQGTLVGSSLVVMGVTLALMIFQRRRIAACVEEERASRAEQ